MILSDAETRTKWWLKFNLDICRRYDEPFSEPPFRYGNYVAGSKNKQVRLEVSPSVVWLDFVVIHLCSISLNM